jgi:mannosyltransferase
VSAERDRVKTSVLKEYFTVVADQQVRGRRVTVYERRGPTQRSADGAPAGRQDG